LDHTWYSKRTGVHSPYLFQVTNEKKLLMSVLHLNCKYRGACVESWVLSILPVGAWEDMSGAMFLFLVSQLSAVILRVDLFCYKSHLRMWQESQFWEASTPWPHNWSCCTQIHRGFRTHGFCRGVATNSFVDNYWIFIVTFATGDLIFIVKVHL